jgi:hypothetical protein
VSSIVHNLHLRLDDVNDLLVVNTELNGWLQFRKFFIINEEILRSWVVKENLKHASISNLLYELGLKVKRFLSDYCQVSACEVADAQFQWSQSVMHWLEDNSVNLIKWVVGVVEEVNLVKIRQLHVKVFLEDYLWVFHWQNFHLGSVNLNQVGYFTAADSCFIYQFLIVRFSSRFLSLFKEVLAEIQYLGVERVCALEEPAFLSYWSLNSSCLVLQ